MVCDGSISERTARLSQPYVGRPDDRGSLVTSEDELFLTLEKAHAADWQLGVHANGDEAIDITLRVYERLQRERPRRDPRFRLEHCTLVNDDLVRRIRALGAIPTPFSTYVYYHGEKMREYGAERLDSMFALRSFLDAGVRVTQVSEKRAAHVLDAGRERLHQQVRIPAVREPDAGQRAASPQIVLGHVVGLAQRESASGIVPLDEVFLGPGAGGLSW